MLPLLAQTETGSNALIIGVVVLGLSSLASLGVSVFTFVRMTAGKDSERQIEPTALHALQQQIQNNHSANQTELKSQTVTLNKLDREMGAVSAKVENVEKNVDGLHIRMGGISRELSATTARVDGMEKRKDS